MFKLIVHELIRYSTVSSLLKLILVNLLRAFRVSGQSVRLAFQVVQQPRRAGACAVHRKRPRGRPPRAVALAGERKSSQLARLMAKSESSRMAGMLNLVARQPVGSSARRGWCGTPRRSCFHTGCRARGGRTRSGTVARHQSRVPDRRREAAGRAARTGGT